MVGVVGRTAVVIKGEQGDNVYTACGEGFCACQHDRSVAALVQVGDQHQVRLRRFENQPFAISQSLIDVRAAAELDAKQHVDGIFEVVGEVDDRRVEHDQLGGDGRD